VKSSKPTAALAGRVEVRRSEIDGRGVFSLQRFRPGARIGAFEGVPVRRNGAHVLWLFDDDDGSAEALRVTNALRFLNHSREPNAEIEGYEIYALRNIQPGCEITLHYGEDWKDIG
jgi:SET domain-containing protein